MPSETPTELSSTREPQVGLALGPAFLKAAAIGLSASDAARFLSSALVQRYRRFERGDVRPERDTLDTLALRIALLRKNCEGPKDSRALLKAYLEYGYGHLGRENLVVAAESLIGELVGEPRIEAFGLLGALLRYGPEIIDFKLPTDSDALFRQSAVRKFKAGGGSRALHETLAKQDESELGDFERDANGVKRRRRRLQHVQDQYSKATAVRLRIEDVPAMLDLLRRFDACAAECNVEPFGERVRRQVPKAVAQNRAGQGRRQDANRQKKLNKLFSADSDRELGRDSISGVPHAGFFVASDPTMRAFAGQPERAQFQRSAERLRSVIETVTPLALKRDVIPKPGETVSGATEWLLTMKVKTDADAARWLSMFGRAAWRDLKHSGRDEVWERLRHLWGRGRSPRTLSQATVSERRVE